MPSRNKILPTIAALPKHRVGALLSAGWARVVAGMGKGQFADAAETTTRTVENALAGNTNPELHTALNSLAADPTALDELLAGYGFRLTPLHSQAANDLLTAAGVIDAMGTLVAALSDGHRDHSETLEIAKLLRPHMAAMTAIVRQADELRGAA